MKNMVNFALSMSQGYEFLSKLETAGLTEPHIQKVIDSKDNELAAKVVKFIRNGDFESTTSQKRARKIMGKNMLGVEEAIQYFGINPTRQQTLALSEIFFSEEILRKTKETHVLVAVFPLSVLEIREICREVDSELFCDQSWYNKESFAKEHGETGWQLVRKATLNASTSKNWQEQLALISEEDEVPTARVLAYTIIGHYLATGERLFGNSYVRTSSLPSGSGHVGVGDFGLNGLHFRNHSWDGSRIAVVGVSSARKRF